jgi:hypothetical protein
MRIALIAAILLVGGPAVSADLPPYYEGVAVPQHNAIKSRLRHRPPHHRHEPPRRVMDLKVKLNP